VLFRCTNDDAHPLHLLDRQAQRTASEPRPASRSGFVASRGLSQRCGPSASRGGARSGRGGRPQRPSNLHRSLCDGAEMTRKRAARAGYVSVGIDASRQPFTITFLASFSAAVLILICNHFGLVDLAAVDPLAWESTISGALGSSAPRHLRNIRGPRIVSSQGAVAG
jgi:hypothetical protein